MARLKKAVSAQVLWHALAYHAKKQSERNVLSVSEGIPLECELIGKAGGNKLQIELAGKLIVNPNSQTTTSRGVPPEIILGWLFDQLGLDAATQLIAQLERQHAKGGELQVDPSFIAPATALLKRLRNKTTVPKLGAVRFEPAS